MLRAFNWIGTYLYHIFLELFDTKLMLCCNKVIYVSFRYLIEGWYFHWCNCNLTLSTHTAAKHSPLDMGWTTPMQTSNKMYIKITRELMAVWTMHNSETCCALRSWVFVFRCSVMTIANRVLTWTTLILKLERCSSYRPTVASQTPSLGCVEINSVQSLCWMQIERVTLQDWVVGFW